MRFDSVAALVSIVFAQNAAAQTTLRFGKIPSTVRNVGSLYLHVAEKKGYFAREGIKVESVLIEGGTDRMVAAMGATERIPRRTPVGTP